METNNNIHKFEYEDQAMIDANKAEHINKTEIRFFDIGRYVLKCTDIEELTILALMIRSKVRELELELRR